MSALRAPFPYFGGKYAVAPLVWSALGQPKHYIEPFAGSCAVLLARPGYRPESHIETVNDANCHLANVWRALRFAPEEVAKWADWPVNHVDLMARKAAMIGAECRLRDGLLADPEWCDPKLAGYWIWAASCWIGSGMDSPGQRPNISYGGNGIHKLGQRPHISHSGNGVHGLGASIYKWFGLLSDRLRRVRVVCGDWSRVCGGDWQDSRGVVGMFFDPPYGVADRDSSVYGANDGVEVAHAVRGWCIERGARPSYRIVMAGYDEHEELLARGWTAHRWKAQGGYGNLGDGKGRANREREALYFSPHCLYRQGRLFEAA